ncbi:CPSF A subunit region-domain-containing protein [Boletus edulis]|nr:CPSF A subunit region-domain-containing protein [Boletus edulis]
MKLVSTFYPPSSVLDSLKCTLSDGNGSEFLVVAKLNRVDIYSLQPEGLHYETGIEIWGRIRAIKSVPDVHTTTVSLLVLTDHPDPELVFLLFTAAKSGEKDLTVTFHLPLFERNARPAEFCHDVLVDPSGAVAVVSIYAGKLKIVVLTEEGGYERDSDASVLELNLLSLAFITTSAESYTLAMLHFDFQQRLQLLARDIQIDDLQLSPTPSQLLPPLPLPGRWFSIEGQTPRLVFVPSIENRDGDIECEGGVLVVGGRKILLYELASGDALEQNVRKSRRTEKKKKSRNVDESADAKQKEKEREWKKKKARAAITWPWSEVTALCPLTQENDKFMIGDKYGRLAALHVDRTSGTVLTLVALGEASSPMTLTYLTNQVVYLGSHFGDSQLLQITSSPVSSLGFPTLPIPTFIPTIKPKDFSLATKSGVDEEGGIIVNGNGSYLIELESFNNLAPIVDGILTVIDGTGQNEIVTCSGGRNTGSLKVVKSGADFREAAALHGISAVDRIWSLREKYSDQTTSHIVVSTFQETHVLRFEGDKGNMVSSVGGSDMGFLSSRTLAAANIQRRIPGSQPPYVDSSLVVQVVPEGVLLLEYDPGLRVYTRIGDLWTLDKFSDGDTASWANREIVAADINASQVVIALNHGRLVLLKLDGNRFVRQRKREFVEPPPLNCTAEISTVTCLPLDSTKSYAVNIAVGFWMSNVVKILSLERDGTMKDVCVTSVLPAAPRSLLLYSFTGEPGGGPEPTSHPHLLIGLVDGSVATFPFQKGTLGDQKLMSIGNLPVTMHTCRIRGRSTVFACGNRTSILYWERDRLQHSPLMLKDISAAAELNTVAYSSSVVLASPDALVIGAVANFDKLHIRSIPLGYDSPRRIVHSPSCGIFAVACTRPTPAQVGQPETFSSTVQVFNHTSFGKLSEFEVEEGEEVTSLHAFTATLSDVPTSLLCAGITSYDDGEREPSRGRLVLLQPNGSRASLVVMASVIVRGCVYAIASRQNMILAAVNSSVVVYKIEETEKQVSMTEASTFNHNYLITTLVSRNDRLLIGDALTSVSLLNLTGSKIEPIAKDYGSLWPTCAELLNENIIVGGNSDYNLFSFRLQVNELHKVLEREGHYYLGDIVNKFLPGVLASHDVSVDIPMVPKQLFVTPAGQIGVIIDVTDDDLSLHMTALQRNLSTFYERETGVSHSKYRAPKNNTGGSDLEATSVGFLDGDFLELFLGYMKDERSLKRIMEGQSEPERLTLSPDQYQKVLEGLQSLH